MGHTMDGGDFAKKAADKGEIYDAVLLDASNAWGEMPESIMSAASSFGHLLGERGVIVANYQPDSDLAPFYNAFHGSLASDSVVTLGFSVDAEGVGNKMAVQIVG